MEKHSPDFDVLPSPSGQNTSMPPNKGAAINLGPYACRPVASEMPHMHPPGDFDGLPTPSGQNSWAGGSTGKYPSSEAHAAPASKGASGDLDVLPTPGGQYPHAKSQNSGKDGGGMA